MTWNWAEVEDELRQLQALGKMAQGKLSKTRANALVKAPLFSRPPSAFFGWYQLSFDRDDVQMLQEMAADVKNSWQDVKVSFDRKHDPKRLQDRIEAAQAATSEYLEDISQAVAQATAARFDFEGFKITNHDRMPEEKLNVALRRIESLTHFFDQHGILPLLKKTLKKIDLRMTSVKGTQVIAGTYNVKDKKVTLFGPAFLKRSGAPWKTWVEEVFIHEIGHHIHYFMHPEAWAVWKAPWKDVEDKKQSREKISGKDRERFWDLMVGHNWNASATAKKLKGVDKIKFAQWLRKPLTGKPMITLKTYRATKWGKQLFNFLRNPKDDETLATLRHNYFGLDGLSEHIMDMDPAVLKELRVLDPSVEKALDALEIPTEYGKTNFKEDFAETFVIFLIDPSKLSSNARFRMKQALSVSGLYGKPIGRLAKPKTSTMNDDQKTAKKLLSIAQSLLNEKSAEQEGEGSEKEYNDDWDYFKESKEFATLLKKHYTGVKYDPKTGKGLCSTGALTFEFSNSSNDPAVIVNITKVSRMKGDSADLVKAVKAISEAIFKL